MDKKCYIINLSLSMLFKLILKIKFLNYTFLNSSPISKCDEGK